MHRALTDSKMLRRLPHGGVVIDNISGDFHGSFLNITFQTKSPALLVFTLYARDFSYILFLSEPKEGIYHAIYQYQDNRRFK